jgi:hypothetical protein
VCNICQVGYYLKDNTCIDCSDLTNGIKYCSVCTIDSNLKPICKNCSSDLLYLYNNTCKADCLKGGIPNCLDCQIISITSRTMKCVNCANNLYLSTSMCLTCGQIIEGCSTCITVANSNNPSCSKCQQAYYLAK